MKKFLCIWIGQLLSILGSQLTGFALGIWVYQQTQSTTHFAILTCLNIIPVILFSPVIGVISDRFPRRWVMILSDLGAGLSTIALAIALHLNYLPMGLIAALIFVNATFGSFMDPAFTAATSQMVEAKYLDRASGLMQLGVSAPMLVAPILGGALLSHIGLAGILWIDVVTFLFAVSVQLVIPQTPSSTHPPQTTSSNPPASQAVQKTSWKQDYMKSIAWLRSNPGLCALLVFFVVMNFICSIAYILTTPYILSIASEIELGRILSAGGVGLFLGGLVLSLIPNSRNRIQTIGVFCFLGGLVLMTLAFQNSIWNFMIIACLFYIGVPLIHGTEQVILQRQVPPELQGRIFAITEGIEWSSVLLGYLAAGPLVDFVFEPLLQPQSQLAPLLGPIFGTGQGRGIALLFFILGICHSALSLSIVAYAPLREVDDPHPGKPETVSKRSRPVQSDPTGTLSASLPSDSPP